MPRGLANRTWTALVGLMVFLNHDAGARQTPTASGPSAAGLEFFEKQVRPVLARRCFACHSAGAKKLRGNLRLDTSEGLRQGGDQGPVVVAGAPDESLLIQLVREGDPLLRMPPEGPALTDREVRALEDWVRAGAVVPDEGPTIATAPAPEVLSEESRRWWSFQPVRDPVVPTPTDTSWARNAVDRFILSKLEREGLAHAPPAEPRTLLRRLSFDLTGLPPTPEELDAFVRAAARDPRSAFEAEVERLLASPAYGERWGRHWLDVVRYADTSGCNGDFPIPEAYRYRNYVIDSFNRDKPYDQFLREQIAGDLLPAESDEARFEGTIATGYLAISRRFSSVAEEFHLTLDDTVDNLGKAMLGLSISCARCHDHKFDPIPQRDYYALYGIFQSTRYAFPGTEIYRHVQDLVPLVTDDREEALRPYLEKMAALDAAIFEAYDGVDNLDTGKEKNARKARWKKLQGERDALLKKRPEYDKAYAVGEGHPTNARVHVKGEPTHLGAEVPRGFLQVLGGQRVPENEAGSGRRQLADWLTDPANPLTARVFVNRVWQHHFGQGLVRTPNDFGTRGEPPTHPELLDYLAARFIESGFSVKALHRLLLGSETYRMASVTDSQAARRDPENKWLWAYPRRRLDAEELRDAILSVSGALDRSRGGPHPFPPEWEWRYTQHKPFVDDYPTLRRAVYLMQQRIRQQPFLAVFDGADTNAPVDVRKPSTTPQQALFLLNSAFVHEQARRFADRLRSEASTTNARIERAFALAFGRPPTPDEARDARTELEQLESALAAAGAQSPELASWSSFGLVLFGSNEFTFVD